VMRTDNSDGTDFKPFFDLVVGVLFILLILISAQLFFSQWDQPTRNEAAANESFRWDEEARQFLQDVNTKLTAEGFATGVDIARRSVAFQIADILDASGSPGTLRQDRVRALAAAAVVTARCLEPSSAQVAACPTYMQLGRGRLLTAVWLESGSLPELGSEETARFLSLRLLGALTSAQPQLLTLKGADGAPYFQTAPDPRLSPRARPDGLPRGIVELRFEFAGKKRL
jgi:hypothetical protein